VGGRWTRTRTPGVYQQKDVRTGKPRYKAASRDSRGVVTSRTFDRFRDAEQHLADMRVRHAMGSLPDMSKSRRSVAEFFAPYVGDG
jgi:hypothetical protein